MVLGARLKKIRLVLNLRQKELADALDLKSASISQFESNKNKPSLDTLIKLSKTYNISLQWLLTGEGNMFTDQEEHHPAMNGLYKLNEVFPEYVSIPLGSGIAAGQPEEAFETGNFIDVPKEIIHLKQEDYFALPVTGRSMEPEIKLHDIVVIERLYNWNNLNNTIVAVRMNGEITLKELVQEPKIKRIILKPYNHKFNILILDPENMDDIQIIGKLTFLIRRFNLKT